MRTLATAEWHEDAAATEWWEGDDRAACERLVQSNLSRIAAVARRFSAPGLEIADLVQEGCLALLEARERYEPERGVPFWAYAAPWVHGAIYRLAYDQRRAVRLPAAARVELGHLRRVDQHLARVNGGEQPLAAVAREAGMSLDRAERLMAAGRPPRSFEETVGPEADGASLIDLVPDPRAEEPYLQVVADAGVPDVAELLGALSGREREVIARRFGLGCPPQTLADIGRGLGVTRERVRQIEARALDKLHEAAA